MELENDAFWASFVSDVENGNNLWHMTTQCFPNKCKRARRSKRNRSKTQQTTILTASESNLDENSEADESTSMSVDGKDTYESEDVLEKAEMEALARVAARKDQETQITLRLDNVMQQELERMKQHIFDDEAYELATTGKSSWTLKKISRYVRELQMLFEVEYHTPLNPLLVRAFASDVFRDNRAHYKTSFLFKFAT